ncbi:MAG: SAM-dependent chlorinase/fluorinase [Anaerolineae bacterium]|nr:SAM-dependent chlorinase/fluorinase [Anaerolineae bacterium]
MSERPRPMITLTTDFGTTDGYVGTMKGVMLDIAPRARLVDITQQIAPQNIRQAAYVLYTIYRFFSSQTVHLVVVDPGVGSSRRSIAIYSSHGTFVGPDNGVFSYVMTEESVEAVVELADSRYHLPSVSQTFHGRDVFAPVAAHLAAGVPISELGPPVITPVALPRPRLEITPHRIRGEVLHTDHFGNVITSIGRLLWRGDELTFTPAFLQRSEERTRFAASDVSVVLGAPAPGDREIHGLHRTYADVERGAVLALVGSEGHVEIAVREGNAAERLGLQPRVPVELHW